jgi:hypothetical protein
MGRDSSVGIASGYGLDGLSAHVQTGPGAYPASSTLGTGSFQGVERHGRDADHTPLSSAQVTKG